MIQQIRNKLPQLFFLVGLCALMFSYGFVVHQFRLFPFGLLVQANEGLNFFLSTARGDRGAHFVETELSEKISIFKPDAVYEGPTLITSFTVDNMLSANVIDMAGEPIHSWDIDWFELWPDAQHISESDPTRPESRPGALIHGAILLDNGDLIFNFDYLGLVRLDPCGQVVWRFPYKTHHNIHLDENDTLWVPGQIRHEEPVAEFPNHRPPFHEPTILRLSLDGELLSEISVLDILNKNKLQGLLFMRSRKHPETGESGVSGDIYHMNDLETFPNSMEQGFLETGDVMISLRDVNTILIFDQQDWTLKEMIVGDFVRQHDPDFVDANTISIFDNHRFTADERDHQSRILVQSLPDNESEVYYAGDQDHPFYTAILGKHERLPNGNMLISEGTKGRAFEIDDSGDIVWEYHNIVDEGYIAKIQEAQRLPATYTEEFFAEMVLQCDGSDAD